MKTIKRYFQKNISENKMIYTFAIIALITGFILSATIHTDATSSDYAEEIDMFFSISKIGEVDYMKLFADMSLLSLRTLVLIFVSALTFITLPFSFFWIGTIGYRIGIPLIYFINVYGLKGALFAITALLFQDIIFLPILIFYTALSINTYFDRRKLKISRAGKEIMKRHRIKVVKQFLLFCILTEVCVIIQTLALPVLLRYISILF